MTPQNLLSLAGVCWGTCYLHVTLTYFSIYRDGALLLTDTAMSYPLFLRYFPLVLYYTQGVFRVVPDTPVLAGTRELIQALKKKHKLQGKALFD